MFISRIKKTKELNRLDLSSYPGKRLYYNKTRNYVSLIFKIIIGVAFITSCALLNYTTKSEADLVYVFLILVGGFFLVDSIFESIGRLLLKNPVLILKGESLFYLHTNKSYDIRNYYFTEEYLGKHNYYGTFCMFSNDKERIIAEKNWHLADEEVFKSQLKYNQLILSRDQNR